MRKYEIAFRRTEEGLRPRKQIPHNVAIDTLAKVCREADSEIEKLEEKSFLTFIKGLVTGLILSALIMKIIFILIK